MELYLTDKGEKYLEKLQISVVDKWSNTNTSVDNLDYIVLYNIKQDGESDIEELLANPEIYTNRDRVFKFKDAHRRLFEAGYIDKV